jgi:hypothetical protein
MSALVVGNKRHRRAILSKDPVITRSPSGLKFAVHTSSVSPSSNATGADKVPNDSHSKAANSLGLDTPATIPACVDLVIEWLWLTAVAKSLWIFAMFGRSGAEAVGALSDGIPIFHP